MKVYLDVVGLLMDRTVPQTPEAVAEAIAAEAARWLRLFDRRLKERIKNKSQCQIGGRTPDVDYDRLIDSLREFANEFLTPIMNCQINQWLDLSNQDSEASRLATALADKKLLAVDALGEMRTAQTHVTCSECRKIGDAVIAMEQPRGATLVYTDTAFDLLCQHLRKPSKKISSVVASERGDNPDLPSLQNRSQI